MSNQQIRAMIEQFNEEKRSYFAELGYEEKGLRYHADQRGYAVRLAQEIGVRATARLLGLQRKTIQRWLRAEGIWVKPCPDWVYDWAYWRRKRRDNLKRMYYDRRGKSTRELIRHFKGFGANGVLYIWIWFVRNPEYLKEFTERQLRYDEISGILSISKRTLLRILDKITIKKVP